MISALNAASLSTSALASDLEQIRARSFERLAGVHAAVMNGGLERAVRAAAAEAGLELPLTEAEAPRSFDEAVGQLRDAIEVAGELVLDAAPARLDPGVRRDLTASARDGALTEADFLRHGIDRRAMAAAGLLVARSVDAALPALSSGAASRWPGLHAVGCDQLAQGPVCIGGTGANTYTQDYALLIDLGGDDVHANSAGGADRVGNALPVSVAIDLGGNDRYETSLPTASGSRVAQGAGSSGIGVLVDAGGSDTYAANSTTPGINAFAQGYSGIGIGLLQDSEGNDAYRISYAPSRSPASRIQGQGFSSFGVTGLLLDRAGNDTYLAESTTPVTVDDQGRVNPGRPLIQSMGYGEAGGVGILADGGGTDSMTMRGTSGVVAPEESREVVAGGAYAEGFGFATLGGTGFALAGSGPTTWTMATSAEAPVVLSTSVYGFGYASSGAFAGMLDAGGDDTYVADTRAVAVRRVQA
ncbi:MAG: hypothetical protein M3245_00825, partial [Actinomycetota bacterium]|nr:hypothetical protein [Actinomycetota bacterium]